ncbi:MAG: Smr/MutS family protein [Rickettsiales bacterium]|nr:Smr/MutS family protein [Rickettsiales bacterium]
MEDWDVFKKSCNKIKKGGSFERVKNLVVEKGESFYKDFPFLFGKKNISNDTINNDIQSNINNYNIVKKFKEFRVDRHLDLHNLTLDEAFFETKKFIDNCYYSNERNLLIVTGKGLHSTDRRTIKTEIKEWIKIKSLSNKIIAYNKAPKNLGGDGAICLILKKWKPETESN